MCSGNMQQGLPSQQPAQLPVVLLQGLKEPNRGFRGFEVCLPPLDWLSEPCAMPPSRDDLQGSGTAIHREGYNETKAPVAICKYLQMAQSSTQCFHKKIWNNPADLYGISKLTPSAHLWHYVLSSSPLEAVLSSSVLWAPPWHRQDHAQTFLRRKSAALANCEQPFLFKVRPELQKALDHNTLRLSTTL